MSFDHKHAVGALIDSAVKGYITINKENNKYSIQKTDRNDIILTEDEKILLDSLFQETDVQNLKPEAVIKQKLSFTQGNHLIISRALKSFKITVSKTIAQKYIKTNKYLLILGICIHILFFLIYAGLLFLEGSMYAFELFFSSFIFSGILFGILIPVWINMLGNAKQNIKSVLFLTFFIILFAQISIFSTVLPVPNLPLLVPIFIFVPLIFHPYFAFWNKARTTEGRKIQDAIEGFKMFLGTTEREKIKVLYPDIPHTFEIFEKYLPYAIALDVEKNWSEQFSDVLSDSEQIDNAGMWYAGSHSIFNSSDFGSSFSSSLTSAISSSSQAPGSSGGSSEGSSGGGGGGGGGGGW